MPRTVRSSTAVVVSAAAVAALVVGGLTAAAPAPAEAATTAAATTALAVRVAGSQGSWHLTVGGKAYTVKGVTYDPNVNAPAKYLPDIASMGANTVRDWGTDVSSTTDTFFAQARANRLRVIAGLWIDQNQNWTTNSAYQKQALATIKKTVTAYKNDNAVLMWDVGNEVMLTLPNATQRAGYAKFIEKAAKAIHAIDSHHLVTSTDAQTAFWPAYEKYAPSLDVFGLNMYGGIPTVEKAWRAGKFTKPYVLTEAGPFGSWEVARDANGQPVQPTDAANARTYASAWSNITGARGISLGGTMFHYSNQTDLQSLWFGIRPGDKKRASYYALAKAWGGSVGSNRPPVVSSLRFSVGSVKAGKTFTLAAPAVDPDRDKLTWSVSRTSATIDQNGTAPRANFTKVSTGRYRIKAPAAAGVYRFYVQVSDGKGNVDIESKTIKVVR